MATLTITNKIAHMVKYERDPQRRTKRPPLGSNIVPLIDWRTKKNSFRDKVAGK
jgi:hypothetical protein